MKYIAGIKMILLCDTHYGIDNNIVKSVFVLNAQL